MSKKLSLLDDNSSDSEVELTVNKKYANSYQEWRKKEELQKCKDLEKDVEDSESSSESENEVPKFDEEFFRALSLLKSKDPRIYDKNFHLFQTEEIVKKPKTKKEKPVYMKDYERNLILEKSGKFSDDEDEEDIPVKITTYDEEQRQLKQDLKIDSDDSDIDDLLKVETITKEKEEKEEADYVKWLKGQKEDISDDIKKDMSYLKEYWNNPELEANEKFIRDYVLNAQYLEKDDSENLTYEEPTEELLSDDEKILDEQEKFEYKYNFRFEEPDEEFIKHYPRTIGDSLRRVDSKRKQKREEKAERIRKEKEQRREELKRLKAFKRKEIEEKFSKLKEISGQDQINLNESDMDSDFDPDKHDQKMREMFNDEYYQVEEEQKPEFPYDDELDSENWNAWSREKNLHNNDEEEEEEEEETIAVNSESENQVQSNSNAKEDFANEMINASCRKKKVKKKSLFAKIISQPKPLYDPDGKSFDEYLDEYYKLDYEDVVGDMPVRFKYRQVIPNDFGLTIDEILAADDKELNRWCSVKKTCQYRNDNEELYDVDAFRRKAQNSFSKEKCLPSVYAAKAVVDSTVDKKNSKVKKNNYQNTNNLPNFSKNVDDQLNLDQCNVNENTEQTVSKITAPTSQLTGPKNKSKKKKTNEYSSVVENEIESSDFNQNDNNEQNVMQSYKQTKKSKKKKLKEMQNTSCMEVDCEKSGAIKETASIDADMNESSNLLETASKSTRKKRKLEDSVLVPESEVVNNVEFDDSSRKSNENDLSHSNSNVAEGTSEEPPKKKKKKKKNKRKKPHASGDKYKQSASGNKELDISDARYLAYGLNPKKIKNKKKYSKK